MFTCLSCCFSYASLAFRRIIGFYLVLRGFTGFYLDLLSFTVFYCVLLGFTGFYWVLLDFIGFYWVSLGFWVEKTGLGSVPHEFRDVSSFTLILRMSKIRFRSMCNK